MNDVKKYSGNWFNQKNSETNSGGWSNSAMRTRCNELYNAMPSELRNALATVTKWTDNVANSGADASKVTSTRDKVWILSEYEVSGVSSYSNKYEADKQAKYAYYTDNTSRTLKKHTDGTKAEWWLRSPGTDTIGFNGVNSLGYTTNLNTVYSLGFSPCFAIVAD